MNELPPSAERGEAGLALAALQAECDTARATLLRLRGEIALDEHHLRHTLPSELVESNAELVLATLRARGDADNARAALQNVLRIARLDPLTELATRGLLLERLQAAIEYASPRDLRFALLFLDLDDFRAVNDRLGHAIGDRVLREVGRRLSGGIGEGGTASRHGGDAFVLLMGAVEHASAAANMAGALLAALAQPFQIDAHTLRLSASVGIVLFPDDGETASTLLQHAEAAMVSARNLGAGRIVVAVAPQAAPMPKLLRGPATSLGPMSLEHARRHAQLREANEHLVRAALLAQELQAAAELSQNKQKELLALVAHELRTPLTPIRMAVGLLGRVRAEDFPEMQAIVEREVVHMSRLVGDLLDLSRVSTGKLRLECRMVDLRDVVTAALDACRHTMGVRAQRFDLVLPPGALTLYADPNRLVQILSNLLDNASKYTPDRGDIGLHVVQSDAAYGITVTDSGIGIPAETLPNVFEPFVQDTHAIGFNGVGLGIGLTVVRELVEAHRGRVDASSAGLGHGSQFVVSLPRDFLPATDA